MNIIEMFINDVSGFFCMESPGVKTIQNDVNVEEL